VGKGLRELLGHGVALELTGSRLDRDWPTG
jgi:hypothetical protein